MNAPIDRDLKDHGGNSLVLRLLELFKYVVNNDRSYKEILTADYTMVNNVLNKIYRSNVSGFPPYKLEIFESWDKLNANNLYIRSSLAKTTGVYLIVIPI